MWWSLCPRRGWSAKKGRRRAKCAAGTPTGAAFRSSKYSLHVVPKKGMVFHGIGPSCNDWSCTRSGGTPKVDA